MLRRIPTDILISMGCLMGYLVLSILSSTQGLLLALCQRLTCGSAQGNHEWQRLNQGQEQTKHCLNPCAISEAPIYSHFDLSVDSHNSFISIEHNAFPDLKHMSVPFSTKPLSLSTPFFHTSMNGIAATGSKFESKHIVQDFLSLLHSDPLLAAILDMTDESLKFHITSPLAHFSSRVTACHMT